MSHFYADIQGNKKPRTCCGTKQSGIEGHIRGRGIGVFVSIDYNEELKQDEIKVYVTGGSVNPAKIKLICETAGGAL